VPRKKKDPKDEPSKWLAQLLGDEEE